MAFGSREINSLVNFYSGISVNWLLKNRAQLGFQALFVHRTYPPDQYVENNADNFFHKHQGFPL